MRAVETNTHQVLPLHPPSICSLGPSLAAMHMCGAGAAFEVASSLNPSLPPSFLPCFLPSTRKQYFVRVLELIALLSLSSPPLTLVNISMFSPSFTLVCTDRGECGSFPLPPSSFVCCAEPRSSCRRWRRRRWWGLEGLWSCVSSLCHPLPRWHYASRERGRGG